MAESFELKVTASGVVTSTRGEPVPPTPRDQAADISEEEAD